MWLVDDEVVGWSNVDQIDFGRQAFMHIHIAEPSRAQPSRAEVR